MGFIQFIKENFFHVAPILICGAFAIAIILERGKTLVKTYPLQNSKEFFDRITELLVAGKTSEALGVCEKYSTKPVAQVVKAGLLRAHLPDEAIEQTLAMSVSEISRQIQKRTSYLATIANVATLLGLLGTIVGLIQSFEAVGHADAQQKAALLSAGIATAMNATMLGLFVAVPCMIAYSFLVNRSNQLIGEIEDAALKTVDSLRMRYYASESGDSSSESSPPSTSGIQNSSGKTGATRLRAVG